MASTGSSRVVGLAAAVALAAGAAAFWFLARPLADAPDEIVPSGPGDAADAAGGSTGPGGAGPGAGSPGSGVAAAPALLVTIEARGGPLPASVRFELRDSRGRSVAAGDRSLEAGGLLRVETAPVAGALTVTAEGFSEGRMGIQPEDFSRALRLVLDSLAPVGSLQLTLKWPDGAPVGPGDVTLLPLGGKGQPIVLSPGWPGSWQGDGLPVGRYAVVFQDAGGRTRADIGKVEIRAGAAANETFSVRIRRIQVRAVDASTGQGVPRAVLHLLGGPDKARPPAVETGPGGDAELWISGGNSPEVFVRAEGYGWAYFRVKESAGPDPAPLSLSRTPGIRLELRCAGGPLPASVRIDCEDGGLGRGTRPPFPLEPDPSGRIQLALASGTYKVKISADGFQDASARLTPEDFQNGTAPVEMLRK